MPLPADQLGRRPERPREGRVWQLDDDDDDDEPEDDDEETGEDYSSDEGRNVDASEQRPRKVGAKDAEKEEDDDDDETTMNAEELAEEERRTAMQKKRATTRAAGAELVSTLAKPKQQQTDAPRSPRAGKLKAKESGEVATKSGERPGNQRSPRKDDRLRSTASTSALPRSRPRRKKDPWNDFDDGDVSDDLDLWPPTLSTTQLSTTLSAKESKQSLHSNDRGSTRSNSRHPRESDALATHAARLQLLRRRKSREAKEQERLRILKLKENDEYLDYGWPRSLQGSSLYN